LSLVREDRGNRVANKHRNLYSSHTRTSDANELGAMYTDFTLRGQSDNETTTEDGREFARVLEHEHRAVSQSPATAAELRL